MPSQLITAPNMISTPEGGPARVLSPGYVRVEDGVIADAGEGDPPGRPDVELPEGFLAPGLVDIQVNGYFGHDMVDADEAGWHTVVSRLPETGVTAFMPTFITAPIETQAEALRRTRDILPGLPEGARVLGVHIEGPFLSEKRKGAHNPLHLTDPTPEAVEALLETGLVKLLTLAPERNGALEAIRTLTEAGVLVSVGHSDATAAQVRAAADAGARKVTHIFNAQSGVHHRDPGVAAQALIDERLSPGLILDLHHVGPEAAALVFRAAPGRVVLVTDAAAAAGMPPGTYDLGGEPVIMPEDGPPLRADGTIAGSGLRLDEAVGNAVGLGVGVAAAVDAASRVPADLVGRPDLGRIAPGAAADLVWLGPDHRARATWVAGRKVFGGGA
ncbi:N-acetylglucosamine 6-phosphate deacetylase [Actinomadura hallensis]|uniref:N-acetylglucosamine 6-phosphate deacetylase n=1 Tax=Actinomadura hallensis TaxID=337895 RepID=A0A543IA05_9ACTN|nr:N-acetylglucosamine-6-phosphate deacetylase [Actinomadura hallensis]TQM67403.1 N-acetylglucosamine 6-phosphate deacetylase [Actinomadura hallensis]HLV73856.1 N-acetylglucosamine-6-phosphate deacetylase [Vulgatibacteraceae bacterium]